MTYTGLEMMATRKASLWLGDLLEVIEQKTGLAWADIRRDYLAARKGGAQTPTLEAVQKVGRRSRPRGSTDAGPP